MNTHFQFNWKNMGKEQLEQSLQFLKTRWELNNLDYNMIKDKIVLDAGCGSGRYSYALKKLGAREVVGMDLNVDKAKELLKDYSPDISFEEGDITKKLNFGRHTYHFVFCNGVLHHLGKIKKINKAVSEIYRVLKPNGYAWVYVCVSNGKNWEDIEKVRKGLKKAKVSVEDFDMILKQILNAGQRFFFIDLFYSKRFYYSKEEYEEIFRENDLEVVKTLERGTVGDVLEAVHKNLKLKKYYGKREVRFLLKKK